MDFSKSLEHQESGFWGTVWFMRLLWLKMQSGFSVWTAATMQCHVGLRLSHLPTDVANSNQKWLFNVRGQKRMTHAALSNGVWGIYITSSSVIGLTNYTSCTKLVHNDINRFCMEAANFAFVHINREKHCLGGMKNVGSAGLAQHCQDWSLFQSNAWTNKEKATMPRVRKYFGDILHVAVTHQAAFTNLSFTETRILPTVSVAVRGTGSYGTSSDGTSH